MKKKIIGIIAAGLLLFASCGTNAGTGPVRVVENGNTPTPIVVPTCTPTASPTPDPSKLPTVTEAAEPTNVPQPSPAGTVAPSPEPTVMVSPTREPAVTSVPEPTITLTPSPEPTTAPEPELTVTPTPEPTAVPSPEPTVTPLPSPTPTPAIDPGPLINRGWQKTVSIDGEYNIIFPELFRGCRVTKTDRVLRIDYLCEENSAINFLVSYELQLTLEEAADEILEAGGILLESLPEKNRMTFRWQQDGRLHRGVLIEAKYPQALLGTSFGEEEWITGVMQIVFSYPADRYTDYETARYNYYIMNNGEE